MAAFSGTGRQTGWFPLDRPILQWGRILSTAAVSVIGAGLQRHGVRRLQPCRQQSQAARPGWPRRSVRSALAEGPNQGKLVGEEIDKWFQAENDPKKGDKRRDLTAEWAAKNSSLVAVWATSSDEIKKYLKTWPKEHPLVRAAWKEKNPGSDDDSAKPEDLAPFFFDAGIADSFLRMHQGMWPCTVEEETLPGERRRSSGPANQGRRYSGKIFFDMWLQEHRGREVEAPVPADMVMTSGSGLDPHITLKNAPLPTGPGGQCVG